MNDAWHRARGAYGQLIGDSDPAGPLVAEFGALDLRPGSTLALATAAGPVVVSGPDDLIELRIIVEKVTGPGSWPSGSGSAAVGTALRGELAVHRPADLLALVSAMGGLIHDNVGAWRTWRTAVESVAAAIAGLRSVTLEAIVVDQH